MPDAHTAAVEAMAAAMFDAVYGGSSGMDEMLESICRDNARIVLAALVRSEAVRAALVEAPCLLHPGQDKCGGAIRGANIRLHLPCILAALSPEAT